MRLAGLRIVHLHWLFGLGLTGASRLPGLRRVAQLWFRVVLAAIRLSGLRLVWTAHNVLPHEPIFHDDLAARRELVRAADLVIVHSPAAERELVGALGRPRATAVVPHGPYGVPPRRPSRPPEAPPALLFFGTLLPYKGVEDLLLAFARVARSTPIELTVAGRCPDAELRRTLTALAEPWGERVQLRLDAVPDEELPLLFGSHDALVLPFRKVTTSGSALLGLEAGIPVVVPELPAFDGMPVLRFGPGVDGLTACLREVSAMDRAELARRGESARGWARRLSWDDVAAATCEAFQRLLEPAEVYPLSEGAVRN
jgi:glycosyltransferase involved in cell wall biosynthesis